MKRMIVLFALVFAIVNTSTAQDNYRIEIVGHYFNGEIGAVAVTGDIALVGAETALVAVSVANPTAPEQLNSLELGAAAAAIGLYGHYAVVPTESESFQIIDFSDPNNLELISETDLPRSAKGLCIAGDLAFIADYAAGLRIYDISSPDSPQVVSVVDTLGSVWDVAVQGDLAYVPVQLRGLRILDISDPPHPTLVGELRNQWNNLSIAVDGQYVYLGDYNHGLRIVDASNLDSLRLVGDLVYRSQPRATDASHGLVYLGCNDGVHIISTSDPGHPVETAYCSGIGSVTAISFGDPYIYACLGYNGSMILRYEANSPPVRFIPRRLNFGTISPDASATLPIRLLNTGSEAVTIESAANDVECFDIHFNGAQAIGAGDTLDIDVAFQPAAIGEFLDTARLQVAGYDQDIYFAMRGGGTRIRQASQIDPQEYNYHVATEGNYAYVAGSEGLKVVNFTDIEAPEVVGSVVIAEHPLWGNAGLFHVSVVNNIALCPSALADCFGEVFSGGVKLVDVSDPDDPYIFDYLDSGEDFEVATLNEGYVYADGTSGFRIYDAGNNEALGHIDMEIYAYDIDAKGDIVYVCGGDEGMYIIDVSDSNNPAVVGQFLLDGSIQELVISDDYGFVAAGNAGMAVVDLADPIHPRVISTSQSIRGCAGVTIRGETAYLNEGSTIRALDISNIDNPTLIDAFDQSLQHLGAVESGLVAVNYYHVTGLDISQIGAPDNGGEDRARVSLVDGWNLISINVLPPENLWVNAYGPDIELMTDRLRVDQNRHHIVLMKDGRGRFYSPSTPFNNIPNWNLLEGYQIKVDSNVDASWLGTRIPADSTIALRSGWNVIAYLPTYELEISQPDFYAISAIRDHVTVIKDGAGHFAVPAQRFSNIARLRPSQGYMIKVNQAIDFSYPAEQQQRQSITRESQPMNLPWSMPRPTGSNMSILITASSEVPRDCWLVAFTPEGVVAGAGSFDSDGRCGMAIWGDDPTTDTKDGAACGDVLRFKLWNGKVEQNVETVSLQGDSTYITDGFGMLQMGELLPTKLTLSEPFPNPFNSSTQIGFAIPEAGKVTLAVYDVAGRLIETITDQNYQAGSYKLNWKAYQRASGVYFIRLEAREERQTAKVMLVK